MTDVVEQRAGAATETVVLYRYDDQVYASSLDEFDTPSRLPGRVEVQLSYYAIEKKTPKGAWVRPCTLLEPSVVSPRQVSVWHGSPRRFILLTAHKKFACETKAEAMVSFLARKKRQLQILKSQIGNVQWAIDEAEGIQKGKT